MILFIGCLDNYNNNNRCKCLLKYLVNNWQFKSECVYVCSKKKKKQKQIFPKQLSLKKNELSNI